MHDEWQSFCEALYSFPNDFPAYQAPTEEVEISVEVPVETIVEKEVIREVPVEVVVEKEVPVEKIVEKEVIREVPVEMINHLDEQKIELLSAILEQSKNILNISKEPRAIYYA